MFVYDENSIFNKAKENVCYPPMREPHSLPEKVEHTSRMLRDTLDRLMMFERTMKEKYDDLFSIMTGDNVTFKQLMEDAYKDFVSTVRTEINLFETNTNSIVTLFKEAINARLQEFNENSSDGFANYQKQLTEYLNRFEEDIREEFDLYKQDVDNIITQHVSRFDAQDAKIDDAVAYMKANLNVTLENLMHEMNDAGELVGIIDSDVMTSAKQSGAVGDGETDDTEAIRTAIAKGGKVFFNPGTYLITGEIDIPNNTIIEGSSFKSTTLLFKNDGCIKFRGTSILDGGTHKKHLIIRDMQLRKDDAQEAPILQFVCCDYVKIEDCWIYGKGKQVLLWECFDSRFMNTDFEWGGGSGNYGIELRSTNGGNPTTQAYEYTNNIYFYGCRFESFTGVCVGSTGENTNKIAFTSCKFESLNLTNGNAIRIVSASSVYFRDCFFVGLLSNTQNFVYLDQVENIVLTGYGDHRNGTYSGKKLFYVSGSRLIDVCINLNTNGAYSVDYYTYGIDTYTPDNYENMRIKVNGYSNDDLTISNKSLDFGSVTAETILDIPANGYLVLKGAGNASNDKAYVEAACSTSGIDYRMSSYNYEWVSAIIPVIKGEKVSFTMSKWGELYANFRYKKMLVVKG